MRYYHWILFPALLAGLLLALGCPAGDDDDSADDDDATENNPVISNLDIENYSVGNDCKVLVQWHVEDADGDLDGSTVKLAFNDTTYTWTFDLQGTPPFNNADLDIDLPVGGVVGDPHVNPDTTYDVELWMYDFDMDESNHLTEDGWNSPDENCF